MKAFRQLFLLIWILVPFILLADVDAAPTDIVLVMCRPLPSQIKNIEHLYEKDLISLDRIQLLCIFHQDEVTDYQPSFNYVEENRLSWVQFKKISGEVSKEKLFQENEWTGQFRKIFESSHGIIFTGGMDIPPEIYGEESLLLTEATTPVRSLYEASFLFHLIGGDQNPSFVPFLTARPSYPVLAICLGAQTMNVAAGGTLYQDIPTEIYGCRTVEQVLRLDSEKIHSAVYIQKLHILDKDLAPAFHRLRLLSDSIFVKRMGMRKSEKPFILTSHHQGLEKLGRDLVVTATSIDGKVVEAVEHTRFKNVLGVQFHPEYAGLFRKGRFYKKYPGRTNTFNLRRFLLDHPPSMKFHQKLWEWFSKELKSTE